MPWNLRPGRLFFSRLPAGEHEFSCLVPLEGLEPGTRIAWVLQARDGEQLSLAFERVVTAAELRRGRAVLAAQLPAGWPDSELIVHVGEKDLRAEVRHFAHQQSFGWPFASDGLVVVGHRLGEPHRVAFDLPSQQFGWDLVGLEPVRLAVLARPLSDPPRSADLACYGQDVLAPGSGVVVSAADGRPEAEVLGQPELPADASLADAVGNHVVIEHEGGVYSCVAHLQPGSVTVAAGQRLASGDVVGAVGTSGNTTGPHLHLHFMDGPDLLAAAPLPVQLTVEGGTYAPVSGEIVGP